MLSPDELNRAKALTLKKYQRSEPLNPYERELMQQHPDLKFLGLMYRSAYQRRVEAERREVREIQFFPMTQAAAGEVVETISFYQQLDNPIKMLDVVFKYDEDFDAWWVYWRVPSSSPLLTQLLTNEADDRRAGVTSMLRLYYQDSEARSHLLAEVVIAAGDDQLVSDYLWTLPPDQLDPQHVSVFLEKA